MADHCVLLLPAACQPLQGNTPAASPAEQQCLPALAAQALVPNLGQAVLALALAECGWDAERAVVLLRRFQGARIKELHALEKVGVFVCWAAHVLRC